MLLLNDIKTTKQILRTKINLELLNIERKNVFCLKKCNLICKILF